MWNCEVCTTLVRLCITRYIGTLWHQAIHDTVHIHHTVQCHILGHTSSTISNFVQFQYQLSHLSGKEPYYILNSSCCVVCCYDWPITMGCSSIYTRPHAKRMELRKRRHSSFYQTTILNTSWWSYRSKHAVWCDVMWCGEGFKGRTFKKVYRKVCCM
jgi:hypothetical protein